MKEIVIVGCRLPNGLVLENPVDPKQKVTLNGLNKSRIIGANYATTEVDGEFWNLWKAANSHYQPFVTGAIFEAANVTEAAEVAKDLEGEKTGFEPLSQEANGVKPADKE